MKKPNKVKKIFIFLLFMLPLFCLAQDYNFRKTNWGSSKEQVNNSESLQPIIYEEDAIGYSTNIAGLEALIAYYFIDNQLYGSAYIISEEHSNKNLYLKDYLELKEILKSKYGEPIEDESEWSNSLYQDNPEEYGLAVSIGHLRFWNIWVTNDQIVRLSISGDNFDISLKVLYKSKVFQEKVEKERKKNVLDDF